jgi:hypothetical protein
MDQLQTLADRVEIDALRGEFTDAAMMNDHDRLVSLFLPEGAIRIPYADLEVVGHAALRALAQQRESTMEIFVQTTHPGVIELDGDTATGRAYMSELIQLRNGSSHLNYAIYHDTYNRTPDGWKFGERSFEIRYLDSTPLAGGAA